jgi:hypothetical protein
VCVCVCVCVKFSIAGVLFQVIWILFVCIPIVFVARNHVYYLFELGICTAFELEFDQDDVTCLKSVNLPLSVEMMRMFKKAY